MSTCSVYENAVIGGEEEEDVPIRPKPIKPHVARFLVVEAKDLLVSEPSGLGEVPLPSIHSREGENRTDTAALMTAVEAEEKEIHQQRGGQEQTMFRARKRIIE